MENGDFSKMKKIIKVILPVVMASTMLLTGCGTIAHGDQEQFSFNSKPSNATLRVDGHDSGSTPAMLNLSRKDNHYIEIGLAGYKPQTVYLKKSVSGWLFGDILLSPIIAIGVDAIDGALYKLTPEQLSSYSSKSKIQYNKDTHSFMVFLVKNPNKHWHKIGQLKKVG